MIGLFSLTWILIMTFALRGGGKEWLSHGGFYYILSLSLKSLLMCKRNLLLQFVWTYRMTCIYMSWWSIFETTCFCDSEEQRYWSVPAFLLFIRSRFVVFHWRHQIYRYCDHCLLVECSPQSWQLKTTDQFWWYCWIILDPESKIDPPRANFLNKSVVCYHGCGMWTV